MEMITVPLQVPKGLVLIAFYNKMGMPYLNQSVEEFNEEIVGFARLKEKRAL